MTTVAIHPGRSRTGNTPGKRGERHLPRWWAEIGLMVGLYFAYDATRGLRHGTLTTADRHGWQLLHLERALHLAPEHPLNQVLHHLPILAVLAAYSYATLHFLVTPAVLIWMYRRHPDRYRQARTWLVTLTVGALIGFWLYPVTPPRILPGAGIHDTLADVHEWGWWQGQGSAPRGLGSLANEFAAMPSLHVAWAVWVGVLVVRHSQRRLVRSLGIAYPVFMALVVIATGNHYLADVVAGAALAGVTGLLTAYVYQSGTFAGLPGTSRSSFFTHVARSRAAAQATPPAPTSVTRGHRCHRPGKSMIRVLLSAIVIGAITTEVIAFHRKAGSAARALSHPNLGWLMIAVAAELVSMSAAAHMQRRMLRAGGVRPSMRAMAPLVYAANAVSVTLPAGTAISTGYTFHRLRGLGASVPLATFTLLSGGALSTLAFGLISLIALAVSGTAQAGSILLGVSALTLIAVVLYSRTFIHRSDTLAHAAIRLLTTTNRLLRRAPDRDRDRVLHIIDDVTHVSPRGRDWAAGLGFALMNWTADLACFLVASRAIGAHDASLSLIVIAYVAGMTVGGISLLPGGLGLIDAAMILALSRGGVSPVTATAAVLLYRAISYGFVTLLGWAAWTAHWNHERRLTLSNRFAGDSHVITAPVKLRADQPNGRHTNAARPREGNSHVAIRR